MIKLDAYDKKILEILINNSREQISTIAKKVRLKRENVNYKINRLVKEGLIKEFNAIIDESKLSLSRYAVFLELVNLKESTEKDILDYIKKDKFMTWAGPSAGKWSLIFDIVVPKNERVENIIDGFLPKFGEYIEDYALLKLSEGHYFNSKFLGLSEKPRNKVVALKNYDLDEKDLKILSLLTNDSKITLVDLSEKVGMTPNGINNRIKNLEKNGFILFYTISLDWKKLDYEWYGIQIKLLRFELEKERKLKNYLSKNKNVLFYSKYIGSFWDYDVVIMVKNSNELRDFINDFRKNFAKTAKISNIFINFEETVSYKLPQGVFE
jgi:Lrp/AsnC family leucine-responsive transcriptional regulator